jgi:hypothetical protein
LPAGETFDRFVGKQTEDRHRDRRHSSTAVARISLSARPILHSVEHIDQTHGRLLYEVDEYFSGYDVAVTGTWQARGCTLARAIFTG